MPRSGSRVRIPSFAQRPSFKRRVFCWSPGGGIGRHAGLKILWTVMSVPVRPRPGAHKARLLEAGFFVVHFAWKTTLLLLRCKPKEKAYLLHAAIPRFSRKSTRRRRAKRRPYGYWNQECFRPSNAL